MTIAHRAIPEHRSLLAFDSVWTREAVFVDSPEEYESPASSLSREVAVRLEVKVTLGEGDRQALVRLRALLDPPASGASFSQLSAAVEGVFSLTDGEDSSKLGVFARVQAPVLLLPYLRAVISTLTAQSRLGAIVLPPINMMQIIERMQGSAESEPSPRKG